MKILALELSSAVGSIAVKGQDDGEPLSVQFANDRRSSAEFFAQLEKICAQFRTWDCIVVGLGPGSYSGVRVAIAAAFGLRLASAAKLIGCPSICAMGAAGDEYRVIGDARRESFFHARVAAGECVEAPTLHSAGELRAKLAADMPDQPLFTAQPLALFPEAQVRAPSALRLAEIAERIADSAADASLLEPIYLRDPHVTLSRKHANA